MASVRVAVRLRPFNSREKDMNSVLVIDMEGVNTIIRNPETRDPKTFAFDYSYWSHDGFEVGPDGELIAVSPKYASQRKVYDDLGNDVLQSAVDGYNSTLFAYGQTGSGKSFSMVGYGVNKGIIPIVCEEMFKRVSKPEDGKRYQVCATMLEIYNECIKDLLNPAVNVPGGLKVRSKPGIGVYVENLTPVACASYEDIERRMAEGTAARTVASTKMNATSSRAHTVFGISFTTITEFEGATSEMTARMNLVDLAGSERAESTGATGDRLKEGCAINASLSALGNVITALADIAMGKKKVFVPYRNSVLTRLLQDALGGNSRTIMIAALSPADVNYDETLGTLRYADRCKKIKNAVVKMENPTDKIIRQLKEENARLMALLSGKGIEIPVGGSSSGGADMEEMRKKLLAENEAKLKEQMAENEKIINEMKKSWEEKLRDSAAIGSSDMSDGAMHARMALETTIPYIMNLHEDPQLSECVMYVFKKGETRIGRKNAPVKQDIALSGLNILAEHALVRNDDGHVTIETLNASKTFVNGELVTKPRELHTGDRLILGNNFVFRFTNPEEADSRETKPDKDREWSEAIDEFSTKQGLRLQQSLGGEMGKLEQEEQQKRKELEEKLAAMEEAMRRERETARKLMEEQKLAFSRRLANGESLTEDEKALMMNAESMLANKERNLEEELSKRRELSEKIIQEQMKRKRQTKKIEERLAKLIPLINEANSMAEELKKPVRFEARLQVKSNNVNLSTLDELRNLKTIDIQIRVTSQENGNIWHWNHVKFDSRLFLMREVYQEYQDFGPRDIPKSKDPFWDPPEAVEIGKAYVYLKALSQLVEIESDFAIVDYKGDEQGQLSVEIFPEGPNGEDLDYLATSEELIGKPLTLLVRIPGARGLPSKYNNDVFVNFSFQECVKETEACELKTSDPTWKFQTRIKFDCVTEELRQYLLKEAAVFEVRGFSDPQVHQAQAAEAKEQQAAAAAAASSAGSGGAAPAAPICDQCSEKPSEWECLECKVHHCDGCFKLLHKSAKKSGHEKRPVVVPAAAAGGASSASSSAAIAPADRCVQCEEQVAMVHCVECCKNFCSGCNDLLHKSAKRATHTRNPLSAARSSYEGSAAQQKADAEVDRCHQCEEQNAVVSCVECTKQLCESCNALLHKSAARAAHTRIPIGGAEGPGNCEQCDEGPSCVKCEECNKKLCDGCNSMLHRSAKRATHTRTQL